jgi:hypothetical protein
MTIEGRFLFFFSSFFREPGMAYLALDDFKEQELEIRG